MNFYFFISFMSVIGVGLWFWRDSLGARELARAASGRACQQRQAQLLDDTVALQRLRLQRDHDGRLKWERLYGFEFTDTGQRRQMGSVLLLGWRVEVIHMEGGDWLVP